MLVRSPLIFCLLCASVGITASPTSRQLERVNARRQANGPSSTLSIDLEKLDKDVHSLLNEFKSELSASRASASTTPSTSPASSSPRPTSTSSRSTSTSPHPTSTSTHPTSISVPSTITTTTTHSTTTSVKPTTSATPTTSVKPTSTSAKPTTTPVKPTTTSPHPTSTSTQPTSISAHSTTTSTHSITTSVKPTTTSVEPITSTKPTTTPAKPTTTSVKPTTTSVKPTTTSVKPTTTPVKPTTTSVKPTITPPPPPTKPTPTTTSTSRPISTGTPSITRPIFAAYLDEIAFGFPTIDQATGFNVLIFSFYLSSGPTDVASAWQDLSASTRQSMLDNYHSNGISLMLSALGSTEIPTTLGIDPVKLAQQVADWAVEFKMDGVDVDYEDFAAVQAGTAVPWLGSFTTTLRNALPSNMVLSHAPVAPWLAPGEVYSQFEKQFGNLVDWYNIQFYSQGASYTTCDSLLTTAIQPFPQSSLFEIISGGISGTKLVIGKPGTPADVGVFADIIEFGGHLESGTVNLTASLGLKRRDTPTNTNGFMEPSLLAQCLVTAKSKGWDTGVMAWEYPDANAQWIQTVRSLAFPLHG